MLAYNALVLKCLLMSKQAKAHSLYTPRLDKKAISSVERVVRNDADGSPHQLPIYNKKMTKHLHPAFGGR